VGVVVVCGCVVGGVGVKGVAGVVAQAGAGGVCIQLVLL